MRLDKLQNTIIASRKKLLQLERSKIQQAIGLGALSAAIIMLLAYLAWHQSTTKQDPETDEYGEEGFDLTALSGIEAQIVHRVTGTNEFSSVGPRREWFLPDFIGRYSALEPTDVGITPLGQVYTYGLSAR